MSNSYFQFQQFRVCQDRCAMKVGTDGVLLGAWARGGRCILDVGTGTGLIALMMAQRYAEARITAIDIDADACRQAQENIQLSPFSDRIGVVETSLQNFCKQNVQTPDRQEYEATVRFDAVVSNPPFFVNALKAPDQQRAMARHADTLSYADLFDGVGRLLSAEGEFSAIVPFDCRAQFEAEAFLHGLHPTRVCAVRTTPRKPPRRYMLAFARQAPGSVEQTEGIIEDAPNVRSAWYVGLTRDFYL